MGRHATPASCDEKPDLLHQRHAGEKWARDNISPGLHNFCETKTSFRWCCWLIFQVITFPRETSFSPGIHCHSCIGQPGRGKQQLEFSWSPCVTKPPSHEGLFNPHAYTKGITLSVASSLIVKGNIVIWYFLVQVERKGHSQESFCGYFLWSSTPLRIILAQH